MTREGIHSIVLKPGPARRVDTRGRNRAGLTKKQGKEKPGVTRRVDPVTRQDPVTNPLTFVFFCFFLLKRRRFNFFFLRIDPADPVKPGDPAKIRNPSLGPGRPPGRVLKL